MEYLKNNHVKDQVIDCLIDTMHDYEDVKFYGCDMSYTLFESYNIDGTVTYNTHAAIEWIKKNFADLAEIVEEIKFQLGSENIPNVFDEPEKFQVVIYLEVASYVLSQCKTIDQNWSNEFILDKKTIEKITKELDKQRG